MNAQLEQNNFLFVPNFISQERAEHLNLWMLEQKEHGRLIDDPRTNYGINGKSCQDALPFVDLLCEKLAHVREIVDEPLLPTYSFSIVYGPQSQLIKHLDRAACEISLTVHLGGDTEWPIFVKKPSGEPAEFKLNPGDAVVYLGCVAEHWRNTFAGSYYTQVFLHYVRSNGAHAWTFFDKAR